MKMEFDTVSVDRSSFGIIVGTGRNYLECLADAKARLSENMRLVGHWNEFE